MRNVYQLPLPNFDPLLRLGDVERALAKVFLGCVPSRPTIVAMIEDGTLDGTKLGRGGYWFVYKSSLDNYILRIQSESQRMAA